MLRRSRQVRTEAPVVPSDPEATAVAPVSPQSQVVVTPAAVPVEPPRREVVVAPQVVNPGAAGGLATLGFLTVLFGAWAGIVPFIGPLIHYNATGSNSWTWTNAHAALWVAPGAVAVLLGLMMLSRAPLARRGMTKLGPSGAGFIVACCGAWLVIGPMAWNVLEGRNPILHADAFREYLYYIGYSFGPGLILTLLGGCAMGIAFMTRTVDSPAVASDVVERDQRVIAA